jgi:hypothetical protein
MEVTMSEKEKELKKLLTEAKLGELSEEDLDEVAGGCTSCSLFCAPGGIFAAAEVEA